MNPEEDRVWLQTRRLLQRRVTPRLDLIESSAPRSQVEEWMHDEIRRWKATEALFRAQREGR